MELPGSNHGGRLVKAIQPMAQAQNRMLPQHARTGVTHHRSDLFAPNALIAMDRTFGTDGLLHSKSAALQPEGSIIQKLPALRAQSRAGMVMALAVTADHSGNGLAFPGKTLAGRASAAGFAVCRHWPQVKGFGGFHIIRLTSASHTRRTASLMQVKVPRE
jgi:hypothetical protein